MIDSAVKELALYGQKQGLIQKEDTIYTINRLLEVLHLTNYQPNCPAEEGRPLEQILCCLLDYACAAGLIENNVTARDLFDTRLMGCLTPRPSEVIHRFYTYYRESPQHATDFFYQFCQDTDYIRTYRIKKDLKWITHTEYGDLDITINLSKPEKDPRAIAAAKNAQPGGYPKCPLCRENEGYAGHLNHPARQTLRVIPLTLDGQPWSFQYSPYVYYNEHCIVLNNRHTPMKIERGTFVRLFDFINLFPHYFIGSNADLPIVGGSILTHDHFQGGNHSFAMARATVERHFTVSGFEDVQAGIVKWPMSVIRLRHADHHRLIELGDHILQSWQTYTDTAAGIFAETSGEPHNTITPIARKTGELFELDMVLRNNITSAEHPLGVFHPHSELHHIKKENIGLIEVMGLAVLPARLKEELTLLEEAIRAGRNIRTDDRIAKHADWAENIQKKYGYLQPDSIHEILKQEVGFTFAQVLEHAGVFKRTPEGQDAFDRFIHSLNRQPIEK